MQPNCSQDDILTILNSFSEIWDNLSEEKKDKYINALCNITIHTDTPEEFDFENFKIQLDKELQGK